jgi:hypothetical protein
MASMQSTVPISVFYVGLKDAPFDAALILLRKANLMPTGRLSIAM